MVSDRKIDPTFGRQNSTKLADLEKAGFNISPQAYVKIGNHFVKGFEGFGDIQNGSLSATGLVSEDLGDGLDRIGYKSLVNNGSINATVNTSFNSDSKSTEIENGKFRVTMFFGLNGYPSEAMKLGTVSNLQNVIGAHEISGHYVNKIGKTNSAHRKLLNNVQKTHPIWENTTQEFKNSYIDKY